MYWDYDDETGECLRYGKTVKAEERYQVCVDSDIELEEK